MSEVEKIFCGAGFTKQFDNGGYIINVSLDLESLPKHLIQDTPYGKRINLKVCPKRNPEPNKPDWYVEVDQYVRDGVSGGQPPAPRQAPSSPADKPQVSDEDADELPF